VDARMTEKVDFAPLYELISTVELLEKRVVLLERVFGRLMQYDLRLDNLEFHSGQPMKPVFNEVLMDIKCRLTAIEENLKIEAPGVRNDE
jgi:hypothetical protein